MTRWTAIIEEDDEGPFISFPQEAIKELGWQDGDEIEWIYIGNGSWSIRKKMPETCFVMVDCIQTYRTRYVVEVSADHPEWALDTVTCQDAKEFSQKDLGETIVSHRIVTEEEALAQFREDTDYGTWSDEQIQNSSITYEMDYVK